MLACQVSLTEENPEIKEPLGPLGAVPWQEGVEASAPNPVHSSAGAVRLVPGLTGHSPVRWSIPTGKFCEYMPRVDFPELEFPVRAEETGSWKTLNLQVESFTVDGRARIRMGVPDDLQDFTIPLSRVTELQALICQGPDHPVGAEQAHVLLSRWLQDLAPDCTFEKIKGEGWTCRLRETGPALAAEQLRVMSREILRKWSRQPYVFSRRLNLSQQLVDILRKPFDEAEVKKFCSLLSYSLPRETPLVLGMKRWQNYFCHATPKENRYWGQVALDLAVKELEFLKKLTDISNHSGSLLVRVPGSEIKARSLQVRLEAEDDVSRHLLMKALDLTEFRTKGGELTPESSSFWHPVFGKDEKIQSLAVLLGLSRFRPVKDTFEKQAGLVASSYLFESLMGESEFVVGNGRYKVLYLPEGSYRYILYDLGSQDQPWENMDDRSQSRGSLSWHRTGRRPAIKTW